MLIHLSICLTLSKQKAHEPFHFAVQDMISRAKQDYFAASYRGLTTPQAKMKVRVRHQFTKH